MTAIHRSSAPLAGPTGHRPISSNTHSMSFVDSARRATPNPRRLSIIFPLSRDSNADRFETTRNLGRDGPPTARSLLGVAPVSPRPAWAGRRTVALRASSAPQSDRRSSAPIHSNGTRVRAWSSLLSAPFALERGGALSSSHRSSSRTTSGATHPSRCLALRRPACSRPSRPVMDSRGGRCHDAAMIRGVPR